MIRIILLVLAVFSPRDSCRALITVEDICPRALLFAEMAARRDGDAAVEYGGLLELSGQFEQAAVYYEMLSGTAEDSELIHWLANRKRGSLPLDTGLVITAVVINTGLVTAKDLTLILPRLESHPPYQEITQIGGYFHEEGDFLVYRTDSLLPGDTLKSILLVRLKQYPYSFRPLPATGFPFRWGDLAKLISLELTVPSDIYGNGPCLELAKQARILAADMGIEFEVVGGVVSRDDSLSFHAWNLIVFEGLRIPFEPTLFHLDSLRAIGHSSTDIIPLWDLLSTDGHELSVYYAQQNETDGLEISLEAAFCPYTMPFNPLDLFNK